MKTLLVHAPVMHPPRSPEPVRKPVRTGFVRDVAVTTGARVSQAACAMFAGILVARVAGPSANGTLSVLIALGSMAFLLGSLGVHYSGVYFLGRFGSDREAVVSNNLLVGIAGGLATGAALAGVGILFHHQLLGRVSIGLFVLYVFAVPCMYFNIMARAIVLGLGRVAAYNVPDAIEGGGLLLGTAAALAIFGDRLLPLVALRVAVEAAISVAIFLYVRQRIHFEFRPSRNVLLRQVRYGVRNYASSLFWVFLLQSDLLLCNYFLGRGPTGVYSIAVSLGLPVTLAASVVGMLTFQRVSSNASRENRVANTNRVLRILVPIVGSIALVTGALAKWLIPLVYGDRFGGAADALILLLPGLVVLSLEIVLMSFFGGEGSPAIVYQAPIVGLASNFAANLFVIPRWGIAGAAFTSSCCYALVFALVLLSYLRSTSSSFRDVLLLRRDDVGALRRAGGASAKASL